MYTLSEMNEMKWIHFIWVRKVQSIYLEKSGPLIESPTTANNSLPSHPAPIKKK